MSRSGKGRILAGLVSLVILACLLPAGAMASPLPTALDTSTGGGYLAGELFLENVSHTFYEFDNSKLGGGTAVYNKDNHTITLTNVVINDLQTMLQNTSAPNCFIYAQKMQQLTVELVGKNTINCGNGRGIQLFSHSDSDVYELTITGSGTLELTTDGADCISVPKVVVDGANLTVNQLGDHYGIYAWYTQDALTLQNSANVEVTSMGTESAIFASGAIGIMAGSELTVKGPSGSSTTRAVSHPAVSSKGFTVDGDSVHGGSVVSVDAGENNEALTVTGPLSVKNGSTLNATGVVKTENLTQDSNIVEGSITIDSSTLEVTGQVRASGNITITNKSTVNGNGYATLYSKNAINIDNKSIVTVDNQGNDKALDARGGLSILDSAVKATSQMNCIYTEGPLTIERSTVEALTNDDSFYAAIETRIGSISIKNATVKAKGGKQAEFAIGCRDKAGDIIIEDAISESPSEVIADGGIYAAKGKISITPARGTMMQVHARLEETGELKFESYFDDLQTFQAGSKPDPNPYYYLVFKQPYVHIKAHQHDYADTWTTSDDSDEHWHACECGAKVNEAPHDFEWKIDKAETETEAGSKHEECTECGYKKPAVAIPPTGHKHHIFDTKWTADASAHWHACTTAGCGEVKDKADHTFQWFTDQEATETAPGSKHGVCAVCQYRVDNVPIPPKGHKEHIAGMEWKSDANAHWHVCTTAGCGEIMDSALHTFQWVTDQEATETAPGSKHGVCTVCGYTTAPVAIPAMGKPSVPQTGDTAPLALWMVLLLASGTAVPLLVRRRQSSR